MYFRCLVYLLLHASAARRHSERFGSTFLSFAGVWEAWNGPPLQGPEGQEVMKLIQALDSSDAYCQLLKRAGCSPRDCAHCAQSRKQEILDAAEQKIQRLSNMQRSRQPLAVFVLGATGAGKTSFIKYRLEEELPANHTGFVRSAIHVNADDLRSELVGGYAIYSALVNQKADFPPGLVTDASFLRAGIQEKVLASAVDFLGDSLTVPAFVTEEFLDNHFDVRIFHIEIHGSSDEAKAETARRGIEERIASG
ncbi:Slc38a1, partial [Symbiodinium sp. CCMP2456]